MSGGVVTAKRSGLTSFSDFGIGYGQAVLPITLSAFNATLQNDKTVTITWSTSAEINNAYFALERSVNGIDFETLTEQQGAGNSTVVLHYSHIDPNPVSGNNYYRLKQVDFDGTFTYGPIRQITVSSNGTGVDPTQLTDVQAFPNPGSGLFTISNLVTTGLRDHAEISVFDAKGQLVMKKLVNDAAQIQLDLTQQPPGAYLMKVSDANNQATTRQLIIQR